jgi:hypothetical protein
MLRKIPFAEAVDFSPWPSRLITKSWRKDSRSVDTVHKEYDQRYDELKAAWRAHKEENSLLNPVLLAQSFLVKFDEMDWRKMRESPDIYGEVNRDQWLMSFQDELYVGDGDFAMSIFRQLVVQAVRRAGRIQRFDTVVEIGCGTGYNLINIASQLGLSGVGYDLSLPAVEFLNDVSVDTGIAIQAFQSDYLSGDFAQDLGLPAWALLSVHALEQSPNLDERWFRRILETPNPPSIGIHLEPLIGKGGEFAGLCQTYAEINDYNRSLSVALEQAQKSGLIEIFEYFPRVVGSTAFNPSSVVIWQDATRPKRN